VSKKLQIIAIVIVVSLVGVIFYIFSSTNPLITQNSTRNQSSEYIRVVLIDDHPRLDFEVEEENLNEMVRALSLTKNVFTFEKFGSIENGLVDTIEVRVSDQVYNQVIYKNPETDLTYRSSTSRREGNVFLIELGINDLDYIISSAPADAKIYLNWLLVNDILVEMSLSINNKYDDMRNRLDRYGFMITPYQVSYPVITNISF